MKLIYIGKTKNVYDLGNGSYCLRLKDDATGRGGVFDPGENSVDLRIKGLGRESLRLSVYFFELLKSHGINTHYQSHDINEVSMKVIAAKVFGRGLEFVCRLVADGSFVKRYGAYTSYGQKLDALVEVTLKDDTKKDPPIIKDALFELNIMTEAEYSECKDLTKKIARIIEKDLASKGLALHDIKLEFGKTGNGVVLIDEISAGCMRVYKDGAKVEPMALSGLVLK